MVTDETKKLVFKSLDAARGKDLISSVSEIRKHYDLTHQQMAALIKEWEDEPDV